MSIIRKLLPCLFLFAIQLNTQADAASNYGSKICHTQGYTCVTVKRGDSWERFAYDAKSRDLLQRINRMNIEPQLGTVVAIPTNLHTMTIYDASPFPRYIDAPGTKTIYVDQQDLAWGAYDANGNLVWWGPISPGHSFCADIKKPCKTPDGIFYVQRKQGLNCVSSQFPLRNPDGTKGGAPMPYCIHFWGGYALHGSYFVPGYADSHGCVRMFPADAQWLNEHFIELPKKGKLGTRIIISETVI